jgi:hypothetical protein
MRKMIAELSDNVGELGNRAKSKGQKQSIKPARRDSSTGRNT